jgi:hypothetical protein
MAPLSRPRSSSSKWFHCTLEMPALLMSPHDVAHVCIDALRNTFLEQSPAELVQLDEQLAAQIAGGPDDQALKLQATEFVP